MKTNRHIRTPLADHDAEFIGLINELKRRAEARGETLYDGDIASMLGITARTFYRQKKNPPRASVLALKHILNERENHEQ